MTGHVVTAGIDAILPIGKPGSPAGRGPAEMDLFNGRPLIAWAAEEALHAGAARILMVAPEEHPGIAAAADQLQQALQAHHAATGRSIPLVQLIHPADGPDGWDGLIRAAARHSLGARALLVDPATVLTDGGLITTFGAFMLRGAARDTGPVPLLAIAEQEWEEALSRPVLVEDDAGLAVAFHHPASDTCLVFAGRALLPLPLPEPVVPDFPDQFPFEPLTRLLLSAGGRGVKMLFHPIDCRFTGAAPPVPEGLPAGAGLPGFVSRLGLGALQRIA